MLSRLSISAWSLSVILFICACPAIVQAQFGGSGYFYGPGYYADYIAERDESVAPDFTPVVAASAIEQNSIQQVLRALNQTRIQGEFLETPLSACLSRLEATLGVRITIDQRALDDAAIGTDTPITKHLPGVTAKTFLTAMLSDQGLTWVPRQEGLLITTKEEADLNPDRQHTVVYPVYDLVRVVEDGRETQDFDSLIDLITVTIQPDSWKEGGGTGEGVIAPMANSASLVVTTTWQIQEEISQLLAAMRQARRQQGIRGLRIETPAPSTGFSGATVDRTDDRDLPRPPRRTRTRWSADPVGVAPGGGMF